jgi:hypothetical protein
MCNVMLYSNTITLRLSVRLHIPLRKVVEHRVPYVCVYIPNVLLHTVACTRIAAAKHAYLMQYTR